MRVLLIEPDEILGASYEGALTARGHTVDRVKSAENGVSAADNTTPDIVVMELRLAEHNGVEFLYEFKSYPEWQSIPVVLLTSVPQTELEPMEGVLGVQLSVVKILQKSQTSLECLVRTVAEMEAASE